MPQSAQNSIRLVLGYLRTEVDQLRKNTSEAEGDRDAHFKQVLKITDELHHLVSKLESLVSKLESKDKKIAELLKKQGTT